MPDLRCLFYHSRMAAKSKQSEESGDGKDLLRVAFGRVLRECRKEIRPKLSQAELSVRAQLPSNAIGDLERGERTIKAGELKRICQELGISARTLLERVKREQLKALGEPESEDLDETPPAKAQNQFYLTVALAGSKPEEILRIMHRMILARGPVGPDDEM